mgnify:CR=1 FL=1
MKIKLLHAVLHDGHRIEAGATGVLDDDLALSLIESGAAEEVPDNEPLAKPIDLPELLAPETETDAAAPATQTAPIGTSGNAAATGQDASAPAEVAQPASADTESTTDGTAETAKAAKAKGSK